MPACALAALPGPSDEVPGQSMARPGVPQPAELKTDRIRPKTGRRVRKPGGRGWVARRRRGEGVGRAHVRTARLQWQRRRQRGEEWGRVEGVRAEGGRGADRKRPVLCHRRAGQGRTRADNPRVCVVSVSPQKRRKLGPRMGRKRTQSGQKSVCARTLGRLVCPFYPKRTRADRIGSRGGVGLTLTKRIWAPKKP